MTLCLPIGAEANRLLRDDPLALLIGMVLDQQVSFEKAFLSPYLLAQRLGHEPDAHELAGYDPEALVALFAERPALHRFPKAMAARVQEVCRLLVERYDGDGRRSGRMRRTVRSYSGASVSCPASASRRRRSSSRCWASGSACSHPAGERRPADTAIRTPTGRSPTSSTTSRWRRCARTSSR